MRFLIPGQGLVALQDMSKANISYCRRLYFEAEQKAAPFRRFFTELEERLGDEGTVADQISDEDLEAIGLQTGMTLSQG